MPDEPMPLGYDGLGVRDLGLATAQANSATRPMRQAKFNVCPVSVAMDKKKLISCVRYAWRVSCHLDVPGVSDLLSTVLQTLTRDGAAKSQPAKPDSSRIISLYDAIGMTRGETHVQQDASSVLTLENKIQVCTCRDFASQTEAEIMTRCQVDKLTEIMQSRFDEVIGQCQEQMAHLQNLVAGSVRSSTSSPSARNEAGPSMANWEESAETKWKHVMDEHVAARVEAKQRRREERIALHSSKSSGNQAQVHGSND